MTDAPARSSSCQCGAVRCATAGAPIQTVVCYCDDCQAAARKIEALPGAAKVTDADGGTALTLFRRDRLTVERGQEHLFADKLRPDSATSRMVAGCCNTALYIGFDKGPFWVSVMRNRIGGVPPPVAARIMTKFRDSTLPYPDDAPVFRSFPLTFPVKLVRAWIPMLLGR